jgi:transposase
MGGRICLTNNAAERELRGIALGARRGCSPAPAAVTSYMLIQTAKRNDVAPQAWLADVLGRINDHNVQRLDQLLPWNWNAAAAALTASQPLIRSSLVS